MSLPELPGRARRPDPPPIFFARPKPCCTRLQRDFGAKRLLGSSGIGLRLLLFMDYFFIFASIGK
jgi:hypothetical protein